eukprot:2440683-Pyramimonas_sp.AAC.1
MALLGGRSFLNNITDLDLSARAASVLAQQRQCEAPSLMTFDYAQAFPSSSLAIHVSSASSAPCSTSQNSRWPVLLYYVFLSWRFAAVLILYAVLSPPRMSTQ